jgi:prepilin signal peptidase PulO-like enzyme (type II secretory pathway)
MDIEPDAFRWWMLFMGLVLGLPLARWFQLAPIWMWVRWGDGSEAAAPCTPPWSVSIMSLMALSNAAIWFVCAVVWTGTEAVAWALFGSGLWLLAWIDASSGWLPDVFTQGLLWLGLCCSSLSLHATDLNDAVWGAVAGYGLLWLTAQAFGLLTGREGLGAGDPKLLAAIGAWMGLSAVAPVLLLSSVAGITFGLVMHLLGRWSLKAPFAFGPFLVMAVPGVAVLGPDGFALFLGL